MIQGIACGLIRRRRSPLGGQRQGGEACCGADCASVVELVVDFLTQLPQHVDEHTQADSERRVQPSHRLHRQKRRRQAAVAAAVAAAQDADERHDGVAIEPRRCGTGVEVQRLEHQVDGFDRCLKGEHDDLLGSGVVLLDGDVQCSHTHRPHLLPVL